MNTLLLMLGLLLLIGRPALARLGETEAQLDTRYGQPIRVEKKNDREMLRIYSSADMSVAITILDGVSEAEYFVKNDKTELSDYEVQLLLAANSLGKTWEKSEAAILSKAWRLPKENRVAQYKQMDHSLTICSDKYLGFTTETRDKAEAEKLKGF